MLDLSKLTDLYERKTRVYPALLCLLPPFLSLSISYPEMYTSLAGLLAIIAGVGGIHFLAQIARDSGKRLENSLFESWGGIPSVAILQHRNNTLPSAAKREYHTRLAGLTGIKGPTTDEESRDPHSADDSYRSWSDYLRANSRNSDEFPLVFKENVNYGFRRNLLGLKRWCIAFSLLGVAIALLPCLSGTRPTATQLVAAFVSSIFGVIAWLTVNSNWVRFVAYEYAKRLIEVLNAPQYSTSNAPASSGNS